MKCIAKCNAYIEFVGATESRMHFQPDGNLVYKTLILYVSLSLSTGYPFAILERDDTTYCAINSVTFFLLAVVNSICFVYIASMCMQI